MPAVLEPSIANPIDRRLAKAAGRIRLTDVLTGGLSLVVVTLAYAAAMILIDRSVQLPDLVRQLGFVGWLALLGYVAYRLIVRPFTQSINPLFVAKKVESAIPDAKNVVVNYVDLQDRDLPESVRLAVARQASGEVTDADVHKAGESRTLVGLGLAAAALAVLLAVFFLAFSPAQFASLVNRAFRPFASQEIVSKTRVEIVLPADPNATITAGTPLIMQVNLEGRLPKADGDERTRLLLRHNPEDPNYETVPFESGATNREFQLKVPEYLVQNGFWYKVVAGDGETSEYRVTVRPRLLVTGVTVSYDYPKYLRMPSETVERPQVEAYRGTTVTVTAKANRAVLGGRLTVDGKPETVAGKPVAEKPDCVSYSFVVQESGIYRLYLTSADGETTIDPPAYPIKVIVDNPPTVRIDKPVEEEITLPVNGLLTIDAVANDDLGLAKLVTKVKLAGDKGLSLLDRPYRLSLKRDADGSFPTKVELKESIKLAEFKDLKEGDVLEYWVEATDHCEVPEGQVGRSAIKRVKLTAAPKEPEKKAEQEQTNQQRDGQQQKHDQEQKQKLDGEKRPPPPGQTPQQQNQGEKQPDQQPGGEQTEQPKEPNDPMKGSGETNPMNTKPNESGSGGEKTAPMGNQQGNPENPKPNQSPGQETKPMPETGTEPSNTKPMNQTGNETKPNTPMGGEKSNPGQAGQPGQNGNDSPPVDPDKKKEIEQKADQISKELNKDKPNAGQSGGGQPGSPSGEMTPEQKQQLQNAAKDLNSSDPGKKAAAEKQIDKMIGKENRERAQQEAEQLKKDLNSKDDTTREAAQKKLEKMAEEMKKQSGEKGNSEGQAGDQKSGGEMSLDQKQKFEQAAKDMASSDPAKKAAGEKQMDQMIGKENREAAQKQADQIKQDLQSDDPAKRQAAQDKLQKMADDIKKQQQAGKSNDQSKPGEGMSPEQKQELAKAGEGMTSNDPKEKSAAEQKVNDALGQGQRDEANKQGEQAKENLKGGGEQAKADAAKKLEKMAQQNQQANGQNQPPTKPEPGLSDQEKKDLAKAAQDLNSSDPDKRAAAERAIDEKIGSDARKQAQTDGEQLKKDLQSDDATTRDAANQKLEQMAKEMQKQGETSGGAGQPKPDQTTQSDPKSGAGKPPTPEAMQKIRDAAKGLNSDNPDEKKAAQETLDQSIGEENRKKAEQMAKDLKSNDPQTRKGAEQALQEMAQQANAGKQGGEPGKGKPTPEEIRKEQEKLAQKAKDLTSKDDATRKQAEAELDKQMGQKNRENLQQAMNDLQSGDPKRQEEGKQKLDDMMKQAERNAGRAGKEWKPNGGSSIGEKGGPALEDNPLDRLKTAELQLKSFKDNRTNKELLAKMGMNQQEYEEFLKGYEKLVEADRKRIAVTAKPNASDAPKSFNANRGGEKLGSRNADGSGPSGASAGSAPPGYSDATRKFAEEAAKKGPSPKE